MLQGADRSDPNYVRNVHRLVGGSRVNIGTNRSTFLIAAASGCSSLTSTCRSRFFHLARAVSHPTSCIDELLPTFQSVSTSCNHGSERLGRAAISYSEAPAQQRATCSQARSQCGTQRVCQRRY